MPRAKKKRTKSSRSKVFLTLQVDKSVRDGLNDMAAMWDTDRSKLMRVGIKLMYELAADDEESFREMVDYED